jgi:hypothetical protein
MRTRKVPVLGPEATAEKVARITLVRAAAYRLCRPHPLRRA